MKTPSLPSRYTARSLLGAGGSGRVYRVHDSIRNLDLALKLVSPTEATWLRGEFDTLRQIRHENLIQVSDLDTLESGEAYYTMELIRGDDWGKQMTAPQLPEEVRRILTGLLRGLAHLHCHGEIHGDLKPGNILLGQGEAVKVADVGMRGASSDRTPQSGTPGYAAPEVWEGRQPDVRSDLYSVGVMAYEALTGSHPFSGHSVREVVSGQLEGWVPSPSAHGVKVPPDIERAVMRAVERNPALRQGSADEFMDGLGVNDRVGEILGGKFVGRIPELSKIQEHLGRATVGSPTLAQVIGPPGIGKSAFLLEAADRARDSAFSVIDLTHAPGRELVALSMSLAEHGPTGDQATSGTVAVASLGATAETLWARAERAPLLLIAESDNSSPAGGRNVLVDLARYLWAVSVERGREARVLILRVCSDPSGPVEPFESRLKLEPMSPEETRLMIVGTFGAVRAEPGTFARIHTITGGNPALVWNVLADLRERGELTRLNGEWTLREEQRLDSARLESLTDFLVVAWGRIGQDLREALLCCALLPNGLSDLAIAALGIENGLRTRLVALETRGWIRHREGHWWIASESVRQIALDRSGAELTGRFAADLMLRLEPILEPEELGDLALAAERTEKSLRLGMGAARLAMSRADFRVAARRLKAALAVALELGMTPLAREASIMIGDALHSLGDDKNARQFLSDQSVWSSLALEDSLVGSREFLLGRIARTLGEIDRAQAHLCRAIESAHGRGDRSLWLRSHAELAEIDWEIGTAPVRAEAIKRISSVLAETREDTSLTEERAALTYGLGAALIYAGDRERAREILLREFGGGCSSYWKMRIANAIGSAIQFLGNPEEALGWLDKAMRHAETAGVDNFRPRILANRGAALYQLGRFREAAEHDTQSANWAHRLGNLYDYAVGRAGTAANYLFLARYEEAIDEASAAGQVLERLGDLLMVGKALEVKGLALYFIGDLTAAEASAQLASIALRNQEYVEMAPRVDWLKAKIQLALGDTETAVGLLEKAIEGLRFRGDLEDLWGVQIELHFAHSRMGDAENSIRLIRDITRRAAERKMLVVETSGAVAISEILADLGTSHKDQWDFLVGALGRAEGAGVLEVAWRLNYRLGQFALSAGDVKESRARYAQATRILREIADRLTRQHRDSFMALKHIRSAIRSMSLST
jgi:tetratricopeptide (TPR) repeat protein